MHDQPQFLRTLSDFARALPCGYDLESTSAELAAGVTAALGLMGSGVMLERENRLEVAATRDTRLEELERVQRQHQAGPCQEAFTSRAVVRVPAVAAQRARWPHYVAVAERLGVVGVASVPMCVTDRCIGALNLYSCAPRDWSEEDVAAATVLADVATGYLLNAARMRHDERLSAQLQQALDSRVVLEQAKGMIAREHAISVQDAFQRMRRHARNHNTSLRSVALAVIATELHV